MTEPVTCENCIHFRRDEINPPAGLGWCVRGRWVGHDGVLGWMELPEIPAAMTRERW